MTFYPLANLTVPRCSCGVVEMDGKIVVFGGYNRGECLSSVEQYDPTTNVWSSFPSMLKGRGRFDAALCNGKADQQEVGKKHVGVYDFSRASVASPIVKKHTTSGIQKNCSRIYVVGGSDGNNDLSTVECFDPVVRSWRRVAPLSSPRSNIGGLMQSYVPITRCDRCLATIGNRLYSMGGWDGENALKDCENKSVHRILYHPFIMCRRIGRSQAGCVVWKNKIYVAGGYDSWHCTNTVEVYDPESDTWHYLSPMNCARRGCGLAVFKNKLYAVGGSDGVESLCTAEWLDLIDPHSSWRPAPSMNTCRANVRVAVVAEKLFAFGGFNGKSFLNTMEYLAEGMNKTLVFVFIRLLQIRWSGEKFCQCRIAYVDFFVSFFLRMSLLFYIFLPTVL
ncbi:unnamed protein product [Soboliphyme baturini]|uniref:F-box/kelch-repeat protein n=1 Tax=Soboliphyme baturini TaxID=241478 RepID=A0A183IZS0_9BILA|nr:unnamed protein product [Soboliphyme baturini]